MLKELKNILDGDYCIGCGSCTLFNENLQIKLTSDGKYKLNVTNPIEKEVENEILSVCPFSNASKNETEMGELLFSKNNHYNELTGYYLNLYAGSVLKGDFRKNGSSGGMVSWIISKLLEENEIDRVIHVKESNDNGNVMFEYNISSTIDEIKRGAKSKYYPIEMSKVLSFVENNPGRYAIVGVPCFIKSLRNLSLKKTNIQKRLKYMIGLVCGHLKSTYYTEMIKLQTPIEELEKINFRYKLPNKNANDYAVKLEGKTNSESIESVIPVNELYGTNWGTGFFKYNACDFCDDVFGETADIVVGDAWLPEFINDDKGTNIVIVRNELINNMIKKGINDQSLDLKVMSPNEIIKSQTGGIRHKREGLSQRLYNKISNRQWVPKKRVEPKETSRAEVYNLREKINNECTPVLKDAIEKNDFSIFTETFKSLEYQLNLISSPVNQMFNASKVIEFVQDNQNIFIWGSGISGQVILYNLHKAGLKVSGFIDSNAKLVGKKVNGLNVYSIEEALTMNNLKVLISPIDYYKQISMTLNENGYKEDIDYIDPYFR
ncbi:Coenzyme F420 hydrogenase/dehydrogenase, beta subunit C-terminal domain [Ureibacillus sp. FSL E2-3493]|uniref:Coenzyme F420 hydrogenase/dehydrogenase, beta subunit C-terminal domain n=1 Tax=Ureibacillus sp. FSL E2-3493 TaxID=2921367 RepID=UPI00311A0271